MTAGQILEHPPPNEAWHHCVASELPVAGSEQAYPGLMVKWGSNLRLTEVKQVSSSPRTDIAWLSFVGMRSN